MGLRRASVPAHSHLSKHWLLARLKYPSYSMCYQLDSDEPLFPPTVTYLNIGCSPTNEAHLVDEARVKWAMIYYSQQRGIWTSVDSDEPVQPPFELKNSKWCFVIQATSKGLDPTARMRRLIWGFARCTYHIVRNLMPRLKYRKSGDSGMLSMYLYAHLKWLLRHMRLIHMRNIPSSRN